MKNKTLYKGQIGDSITIDIHVFVQCTRKNIRVTQKDMRAINSIIESYLREVCSYGEDS